MKLSNKVIIVANTCLIVFLIILPHIINVNHFGPYSAEVWGTVGDWVMIIVTGVTAFYLYQSLEEQRQLTEIEQIRYIESIKPDFRFLVEPNIRHNLVMRVEPIIGRAYNLKLETTNHYPNDLNFKINTADVLDFYSLNIPFYYYGDYNQPNISKLRNWKNRIIIYSMKLKYQDRLNNLYEIIIQIDPEFKVIKDGPNLI